LLWLTGLWVFLTILPTLILNNKKEDKPLTKRDYIGWGLWAVGFILETVADYQKSSFRSNPDNAVMLIFNRISYVMYIYDLCGANIFMVYPRIINQKTMMDNIINCSNMDYSFFSWKTIHI